MDIRYDDPNEKIQCPYDPTHSVRKKATLPSSEVPQCITVF